MTNAKAEYAKLEVEFVKYNDVLTEVLCEIKRAHAILQRLPTIMNSLSPSLRENLGKIELLICDVHHPDTVQLAKMVVKDTIEMLDILANIRVDQSTLNQLADVEITVTKQVRRALDHTKEMDSKLN